MLTVIMPPPDMIEDQNLVEPVEESSRFRHLPCYFLHVQKSGLKSTP
jgi:hypothetical protein